MKRILLVVSICTSVFFRTSAQDGPKVVVFNSPQQERVQQDDSKNILKFSVLEAFSGDFSFYYERVLTENISAEIGVGITLSDYITSLYNNDINVFDNSYEALFGQSLSLGLRYYPLFASEEFYVSPEFKFKVYNNNRTYETSSLSPTGITINSSITGKEKRAISVGRITFGYHYLVEHNIFLDFYGGFGIAKISETNFNYVSEINPVTGENIGAYDYIEGSRLAPRIHLGLKVGIAF